jgi:DNA helicase IV
MLVARCPSRRFTIVGDRAQARHGFVDTWTERLARVNIHKVRLMHLSVNYRTPAEIMAAAEPLILAAIPDANVPVSVRSSGIEVSERPIGDRDVVLDGWLTAHPAGIACVIRDPTFTPRPRVQSHTPASAKGLEFDLVLLVDPAQFGDDVTGAVDRYVAMTRATAELVILQPARR